jgi:hypothetical protein
MQGKHNINSFLHLWFVTEREINNKYANFA